MEMTELDTLVPQYGEHKREMDKYTKLCDGEKDAIKTIMADYALQHYTSGGYTVKRSVQERTSFNEELLLETIKRIAPDSGIIKTKEYVDMDALEAAMYHDEFSRADLMEIQKAKEVKLVTQLRVSKDRKKKDEGEE